jgi:hypothetical protein
MPKPQQAQNLTERVTSLEPGIYTADSNTDGYGSLMAAVALGSAQFLGEDYISNDLKSIAVQVGGGKPKKNPDDGFVTHHVKIGADFYSRALKEYDPPILMLFREIFQNSIDAGARVNTPDGVRTLIDTTITSNPDGTQTIVVEDNAGGMTSDVLQNKFLTISESGKRGDVSSAGSAGGFGVAKELILFPWLSYEVHTQDTLLKGSKGTYGTKKAPFLKGTKITLVIQSDYHTSGAEPVAVIERSHLQNVRFRVNGEIVRPALEMEDSDEVQHFEGRGKMRLFYKPKSRKITGFYVRKQVCSPSGEYCGSLFMFSKSIESSIPGCFCLDITGSSLDTLMANRMTLRYPWSSDLEGYLRSLVKDKHNATRKKNNAMHRKWTGAGKMRPKAEAAGALAGIMSQFVGATDKFNEATNVAGLKEILKKNAEERAKEAEEEEVAPNTSVKGPEDNSDELEESEEEKADDDNVEKPTYTTTPELMDVVTQLPNVEEARPGTIGNAIKHLAWEQDFYIHNEIEGCSCGHSRDSHAEKGRSRGSCNSCDCVRFSGFKVPKRFMPTDDHGKPTMAPVLRKISRFWGEVCRAILIAADKPFVSYGVGWMFDSEFRDGGYKITEGEYVQAEGEKWLLLNPFKGGLIQGGKLYSLRSDADLDWIFSIAVHECAHLTYGEGGHDEGYAREITELIAKSKEVGRLIKKIRDIVVKRPEGWKPKEKAPPKPKVKKIKFNETTEELLKKTVATLKRKSKDTSYLHEVVKIFANDNTWNPIGSVAVDTSYRGASDLAGNRYGGDIIVIDQRNNDKRDEPFSARSDTVENLLEVLLDELRPVIANTFPEAVVTETEITADLKKVLKTMEGLLVDAAMTEGENFRANGEMPGGGLYQVDVSYRKWRERNWWIKLTVGYEEIFGAGFTGPDYLSDDWAKKLAKIVVKAITPKLAEKWRE